MERAGDLLNSFFRLHNISGGDTYVSFFNSWHDIVGTDLAAHTQPIDIRGDALIIEVDHPGWMQLLSLEKDRVVGQINQCYSELGVANIHMKLVESGAFSGPETIQSEAEAYRKRSAEERKRAENSPPPPPPSADEKEALSRVSGENLKSTLERLRRELHDED